MSSKPKVLVFAGSARTQSFNKKLALIAADAAYRAGAEITYIDLRDFPLPIYDGDLEAQFGLPREAVELRHLFRQTDGLLIASPEYNHSFSPLLKNTIDWISRQADGEDYRNFFGGKLAALLATSPGSSGGTRGLPHLRQVLSHLGTLVIAEQVTIAKQFQAFAEDGSLKDSQQQASTDALARALVAGIGGMAVSEVA
jgi:chromate reductase